MSRVRAPSPAFLNRCDHPRLALPPGDTRRLCFARVASYEHVAPPGQRPPLANTRQRVPPAAYRPCKDSYQFPVSTCKVSCKDWGCYRAGLKVYVRGASSNGIYRETPKTVLLTSKDDEPRVRRTMLHAILHGKIDESMPEPQRREDALTSSVFGTLVLVEAREALSTWLDAATSVAGEATATPCGAGSMECWFWPRLRFAEPDVLLRLGNRLFVVEAKLASGRHDLVLGEDEERIADQLVRQWQSLQPDLDAVHGYAPAIRRAIHECDITLVYLFNSRRARTARAEARESLQRLPANADLKLLTWQQLYRNLLDLPHRWARELCHYLELTGLAAFAGFRRAVTDPVSFAPLTLWRAGSRTRVPEGLRLSVEPVRDHSEAIHAFCRRYEQSIPSGLGMGIRAACQEFLPVLDLQGRLREWTAPLKQSGRTA